MTHAVRHFLGTVVPAPEQPRPKCVFCLYGVFPPYCEHDDAVRRSQKQHGVCFLSPPDVAGHRPPIVPEDFCSHHSPKDSERNVER